MITNSKGNRPVVPILIPTLAGNVMFKHILVPLDGSLLAQAALPAAAYLSVKFNASVTLVHIIEKNAPREIHGQPHLRDAVEAAAYLKKISRQWFPQGLQIECHVHTTEVDNVAESIVQHTGELDLDLIVMCSHGRGRALHLILGNMAQKVISMGSIPVLIARPGENEEVTTFSCTAVLTPLDGDLDHEQALPVAKILAKACLASIRLAMVVPRFGSLSGQMTVTSRFLPGTMSRMLELSVRNAEAYLKSLADVLISEGFNASAHVRRGDPANIIVAIARQLKADVIVLATHGKSGMEAFWAGSVAHKVCSQCRIPILLIPVEKPKMHAMNSKWT
jgi:nucleotide-binding universal stress UspA family protein